MLSTLDNYEHRPGQSAMMKSVYDAFATDRHALLEAGTGTGKTLAYMIAALYWSKNKDKKVVISTHTIPLQDQIHKNELPKLKSLLPFSFNFALLKGRNHYLCLRKFEQLLFAGDYDSNYDTELTKMQILVWLTETETGDREELNLPSGGFELWSNIQSDSSCLPHTCPWFEYCFHNKAKEQAKNADLIITNHSLVLSDLLAEHNIIPKYDYIIIDEAHHLEYIASQHLGSMMSYQLFNAHLQRMIGNEKTNLSKHVIEVLEIQALDLTLFLSQVTMLSDIKDEVDSLFTLLSSYAAEQKSGLTEGNIKSVRIIHNNEQGDKWLQILKQVEKIMNMILDVETIEKQLGQELDHYKEELSSYQRGKIQDWQSAISQCREYALVLKNLLLEADPSQNVYWIEYGLRGAKNKSSVHMKPIEIKSTLQENLFNKKKSIIFTSATLQVKGSFDYFMNQLGLPVNSTIKQSFDSPYQYEQQATMLISNDISMISEVDEQQFIKEIAESIVEMAKITNGRMLVLFTSHHMLKKVHHHIKFEIHNLGIVLLAQGIDSGSRTKLTRHFQHHRHAILLGTSSFWEGIDIPGEDLSCLVIAKLPFTPPNTPEYEAKCFLAKEEGLNPFMDYALPQAIIRFKQGFGRLIRSSKDKGVIVVFDRRIVESRYGKFFIQSLPPIPIQSVNRDELKLELKRWLG